MSAAAVVSSAILLGARGVPVAVEVRLGGGRPGFSVVGLADEACRELRDRVRAALLSSGLAWPQRDITVTLTPSRHHGGSAGLDLPIAVGVLAASHAVPADTVGSYGWVGGLGLDGSLRPVPGIVPLVAALDHPVAVVPSTCVSDAELVAPDVHGVTHLPELVAVLRGERPWLNHAVDLALAPGEPDPDLADVRGHRVARTALEVAAAGGHHLLLVGPPGSGTTMLARRLAGLLPSLDSADALDVTMIHSAAGLRLPAGGLVVRPPLRAPHPDASVVATIGGGSRAMRPGEASCAHTGVLLLENLGEFPPSVLAGLREPLDHGVIRVMRGSARVELPARFLMVATMNPCPCGLGGVPGGCACSQAARLRYLRRLSGPLLAHFDLRIQIRPTAVEETGADPPESSATVAARVRRARERAAQRDVRGNAELPADRLDDVAPLTVDARRRLRGEYDTGRLSAQGLHGVRRVARTIVDLRDDDQSHIDADAVGAALRLRGDPLGRWSTLTHHADLLDARPMVDVDTGVGL